MGNVLGAGWVWDFGNKRCITNVEFALGSNPPLAGFCTQVAYVRDNPGWNPDQAPSPRLRKIIAEAGDC